VGNIKAIITGASSGIGREAAILLTKSGCNTWNVGRRPHRYGEPADDVVGVRLDLRHTEECQGLIGLVRASGDVCPVALINVAGVAHFGSTDEMPIDCLKDQIEVNLLGTMLLTQAALPLMLECGGHIVNVLSIGAKHPFPGAAAYCASKAGLLMFGKSIAAEYRGRGIRVTSILPGSVDTPLWDSQSFQPDRADMLSVGAVAECISDVVLSPPDRSFDEIVLMPPKGIL